jgi:hypothetical protein
VNLALCLLLLQAGPEAERPPLPADLKGLRDSNVFSPARPKGSERTFRRDDRRPETRIEPAKPKAPLITGIVYDASLKGFKALVEDRNDESRRLLKEPTFAKPGDVVAGVTVEAVENNVVRARKADGAAAELAVGDPWPAAEAAPPAEGSTSAPPSTSTTPDPGQDEVRKRLKLRVGKKNRPSDPDE